MPEINQIFFSHKEVVELFIKKTGIHEGKWMLAGNFGFSAGNFGPSPDKMSPGGAVVILQLGMMRAPPEYPDASTVDASIVNPGSDERN